MNRIKKRPKDAESGKNGQERLTGSEERRNRREAGGTDGRNG